MENPQENAVVEYVSRDGQPIKLTPSIIKKYLVSGKPEFVTMQELYLYMGVCKARGMNPWIRDCYLIKYTPNDSAAAIVSIDFKRKRARAQADCRGWKCGVILKNNKAEIEYREGALLLEDETLLGGWFEAKPSGWDIPMKKTVNLRRYIKKTKTGEVTRFWSPENQPEQISKVAESQGLSATWPDEFQGLYVDAERESMEAQSELSEQISISVDAEAQLKEKLGEPQKEKIDLTGGDTKSQPEDPPAETEEKEEDQKAPEEKDSEDKAPGGTGDLPIWSRQNWWNLKKGKASNTGFKAWIEKHKDEILLTVPRETFDDMHKKWAGMYNTPFPLLEEHGHQTVEKLDSSEESQIEETETSVSVGKADEYQDPVVDDPPSNTPCKVHHFISTEDGMKCQKCGCGLEVKDTVDIGEDSKVKQKELESLHKDQVYLALKAQIKEIMEEDRAGLEKAAMETTGSLLPVSEKGCRMVIEQYWDNKRAEMARQGDPASRIV